MTAYEMRISDWSSDVCSSDLVGPFHDGREIAGQLRLHGRRDRLYFVIDARIDILRGDGQAIFALQAFVQRFDGLHCLDLILAQNLVSMNPARKAAFPMSRPKLAEEIGRAHV